MKLDEVILSEGIWDSTKAMASKAGYALTGQGQGGELAVKDNFVKGFTSWLNANSKSAVASGHPVDLKTLVNAYLKKNHWNIPGPEWEKSVTNLTSAGYTSANAVKLGNLIYQIASAQQGTAPDGSAGGGTNTQTTAPAEKLTPMTVQVINVIKKLQGKENLDDLAKIAKVAMSVLYKQNPEKYTALYKEIMSGSTKKQQGANAFGQMASQLGAQSNTMANAPVSATGTSENPNIVKGTNEAKRK